MTAPRRFCFLNEEREVAEAADWNRSDWSRLWVYNLHYFDDLDALGSEARAPWHEALISRWIAENPAPSRAGWEPYCLSLRIVNWCRWAWRGHPLPAGAVQNLAVQARALVDQVEVHLLGNHLFANAKALIFAGLFFEGPEADRWLALGRRYLQAELPEQVLPDGGHFERSPMYHAIIAADLLDLLEAERLAGQRLGQEQTAAMRDAAAGMLTWASAMCHDDGDLSFFNDSASGIAPTAADLDALAVPLGLAGGELAGPVQHLQSSGYVRARMGPALLLMDVGVIGPDYLPGHAHADTLSFELSLDRRRLLVNTGTSEYVGDRRRFERGTAAHNSVVVEGRDSSEVWSSFRVARRARPMDVTVSGTADSVIISGAHDGYRRLGRGTDHRRSWRLSSGALVIEDVLTGAPRSAEAWFHFHPDVDVDTSDGEIRLMVDGATVIHAVFEGGAANLVDGFWSPEFGRLVPNKALCVRFDGLRLVSRWRWSP